MQKLWNFYQEVLNGGNSRLVFFGVEKPSQVSDVKRMEKTVKKLSKDIFGKNTMDVINELFDDKENPLTIEFQEGDTFAKRLAEAFKGKFSNDNERLAAALKIGTAIMKALTEKNLQKVQKGEKDIAYEGFDVNLVRPGDKLIFTKDGNVVNVEYKNNKNESVTLEIKPDVLEVEGEQDVSGISDNTPEELRKTVDKVNEVEALKKGIDKESIYSVMRNGFGVEYSTEAKKRLCRVLMGIDKDNALLYLKLLESEDTEWDSGDFNKQLVRWIGEHIEGMDSEKIADFIKEVRKRMSVEEEAAEEVKPEVDRKSVETKEEPVEKKIEDMTDEEVRKKIEKLAKELLNLEQQEQELKIKEGTYEYPEVEDKIANAIVKWNNDKEIRETRDGKIFSLGSMDYPSVIGGYMCPKGTTERKMFYLRFGDKNKDGKVPVAFGMIEEEMDKFSFSDQIENYLIDPAAASFESDVGLFKQAVVAYIDNLAKPTDYNVPAPAAKKTTPEN